MQFKGSKYVRKHFSMFVVDVRSQACRNISYTFVSQHCFDTLLWSAIIKPSYSAAIHSTAELYIAVVAGIDTA